MLNDTIKPNISFVIPYRKSIRSDIRWEVAFVKSSELMVCLLLRSGPKRLPISSRVRFHMFRAPTSHHVIMCVIMLVSMLVIMLVVMPCDLIARPSISR